MAKKTVGGEQSVVDHKFFQFSRTIPLKEIFEDDYDGDSEDDEESSEDGIHGNQFAAHEEIQADDGQLNKSVIEDIVDGVIH